jgi:hypothetical protein
MRRRYAKHQAGGRDDAIVGTQQRRAQPADAVHAVSFQVACRQSVLMPGAGAARIIRRGHGHLLHAQDRAEIQFLPRHAVVSDEMVPGLSAAAED